MNDIAHTIFEQLGGRKFIAMTGAKNFVSHSSINSLSFKVPHAAKKITYVEITLNERDLYDMEFRNVRFTKNGGKNELVEIHKDVFFDQLQEIFTSETGLYTSLF
jgi:hypothetical protein